jgi:Zn-dependent protease/CBS domain-containing protein
VGTYRGIGVYLHATFLLLLAWLFLAPMFRGAGAPAAAASLVFVVLLFFCVVLHEFGHALTAQRFGIQTRDITLYPIGGVARLERIPRNPRQELWIALAGPAVNLVIALALFLIALTQHAVSGVETVQVVGGNLVTKLMWVNLTLAGFNLLPAFPMDGGRVLRAYLAMRMEYGAATRMAATVGQAMAMLFGLVGLLTNPMLLFVAFFVYLGAGQEAAMVQTELAFRGVPVHGAMMTRFGTVSATDTLSRAADMLLEGTQHDFPVLQGETVVGLLTRAALIQGLSERGPASLVGQAMCPAPPSVPPGASLEQTYQQMREAELNTVPVMEGSRLVGLVTLENIGEFVMLRSALEQRASASASRTDAGGSAGTDDVARPRHWMPGRRSRG